MFSISKSKCKYNSFVIKVGLDLFIKYKLVVNVRRYLLKLLYFVYFFFIIRVIMFLNLWFEYVVYRNENLVVFFEFCKDFCYMLLLFIYGGILVFFYR